MKVIKRNGTEVVFDITKIILAITKANESVDAFLAPAAPARPPYLHGSHYHNRKTDVRS